LNKWSVFIHLFIYLFTLKFLIFTTFLQAACINEAGEYIATPEQISFWENAVGEPFAPPLQTNAQDTFRVTCPGCGHSWDTVWVSAVNDRAVSCCSCDLRITDEILGAAAVLHDINRAISGDGIGLAYDIFPVILEDNTNHQQGHTPLQAGRH
jgi:ribosomal protein S27E